MVRQVDGGDAACDPLEPHELQQQQEADPTLKRLRGWLAAGQRPERQEIMAFGPEVKAYHSQWATLTLRDGLLYRQWQTPDGEATLLQLLVPRSLRHQVLQLVHGSVGMGHFGVPKTLRRLRSRFYWAGCWLDIELYVHCCDACTAKKGTWLGLPWSAWGLTSWAPSEAGNRYILIAMDYLTKWHMQYPTRVRPPRREAGGGDVLPIRSPR